MKRTSDACVSRAGGCSHDLWNQLAEDWYLKLRGKSHAGLLEEKTSGKVVHRARHFGIDFTAEVADGGSSSIALAEPRATVLTRSSTKNPQRILLETVMGFGGESRALSATRVAPTFHGVLGINIKLKSDDNSK